MPLKFALAVSTVLVAGCAPLGPLRTSLQPHVVRPTPRVVVFLCDGLDPAAALQGAGDGSLPNIQRYFVAGGTRVRHAITTTPSITYCAITSLITGTPPERHGIPGNVWFEPERRLFRDYGSMDHYRDVNGDYSVPTIYERIAPLRSATIQGAHIRGVTDDEQYWAQAGIMWFLNGYSAVDALSGAAVDLVAQHSNSRGWWPDLLLCYFPGVDTVGHEHGVSSPQYRAAMRVFDDQVGRVCDWLTRQGMLEQTQLVLLSDHGQMDVSPAGHIDLTALIADHWGRRATGKIRQEPTLASRRRYYDQFDAVVNWRDGRRASLHFAGANGWDSDPTPAQVAEILNGVPADARLWNQRGVDLVVYLANEAEAVLRNWRGTARVKLRLKDGTPVFCYVPEPDDVLGYMQDATLAAFVAQGYHPARDWLTATCAQEYPDAVPHMIPLLHNHHFGDVLVFAAPYYSFCREWGGHGGVRAREKHMTMMFAGPGIPRGATLECAHAVDVVPTLMSLLNCDTTQAEGLDGVALFPKAADERAPTPTR